MELAGYTVWHDLGKLKGGDLFWEKIEKAIRNESIRFVAVVSRTALAKEGVQKEWALAEIVERQIPGFVIPARVDGGVAFSDFPISMLRKNAIDFASGWHRGLAQLLDSLADAKLDRATMPDPSIARHWLARPADGAIEMTSNPEPLDSSWLEILSLPETIETARILGRERGIKVTPENGKVPWFEFEDRIVGFARSAELVSAMSGSAMLKPAGGVETKSFIGEGSTLGEKRVTRGDARRRVVNLTRQAWELAMEARGLRCHEMSLGKKVFYASPELTGGRGKMLPFPDHDGRTRRKALNGRSEARKAGWAYAVGVVPAFDDPWRLELRATVVFTDDEDKPIEARRAHRLRRGFCKNWWNDHWRLLLRSYLWLLSEGKAEIALPVGSGRSILVKAQPLLFEAAAGLSDVVPLVDEDPPEELDDESSEDDEGEEE